MYVGELDETFLLENIKILHITKGAVLVELPYTEKMPNGFGGFIDKPANVWIPLTQVSCPVNTNDTEIEISYWIAEQKGLV